MMDVITYPNWYLSWSVLLKVAPGVSAFAKLYGDYGSCVWGNWSETFFEKFGENPIKQSQISLSPLLSAK